MSNNFYLPILKFKLGEKQALAQLYPDQLKKIVPLFELVKYRVVKMIEGKKVVIEKQDSFIFDRDLAYIRDIYKGMLTFIDTKLLTDVDRMSALDKICQNGTFFDSNLLPVIYLPELKNKIRSSTKEFLKKDGFCLRLKIGDIDDFKTFNFGEYSKDKIHLLFDFEFNYQVVEDTIKVLNIKELSDSFKTVTIAIGTAPKSLVPYSLTEVSPIPRNDWLTWRKVRNTLSDDIKLSYGDYTIRYPILQMIDMPNTSCSLRYTGNSNLYIFRGFAKTSKDYHGLIQFRAHAVVLTNSKEYEFSGRKFSEGDRYIKLKAKLVSRNGRRLHKNKNCGTNTTWIRATINHHICKVVSQIY